MASELLVSINKMEWWNDGMISWFWEMESIRSDACISTRSFDLMIDWWLISISYGWLASPEPLSHCEFLIILRWFSHRNIFQNNFWVWGLGRAFCLILLYLFKKGKSKIPFRNKANIVALIICYFLFFSARVGL